QADGLEVNVLMPTDLYLNATFGAYNKIGAENDRADNAVDRPLYEFTYLARVSTYRDFGDDHSLELGADTAWTPKRTVVEDVTVRAPPTPAIITRKDTWRTLNGLDLTYRYHPAKGGLYKGLLWATELMHNDEQRFNPASRLPTGRSRALGGFSYLQAKM